MKDNTSQTHLKAFNLNHHVWVKIKEEGYLHMKSIDDSFLPKEFQKPISFYRGRADDEGYTRFQMWEFMRTFGSTLSKGSQLLINPTIIFDESDFTPIN